MGMPLTLAACAVTKAATAPEAFARLRDLVPSAVVTAGPDGAYVRYAGVEAHVPAPAKISTSTTKITAPIVDKVHGVRMWITPGTG